MSWRHHVLKFKLHGYARWGSDRPRYRARWAPKMVTGIDQQDCMLSFMPIGEPPVWVPAEDWEPAE